MDIDFKDKSFIDNPWPVYDEIIAKKGSIVWSNLNSAFFVFGYDDARTVLTSDDYITDYPFRTSRRVLGSNLLDMDDERHEKMRKVIRSVFSPDSVKIYIAEYLQPLVEGIVNSIRSSKNHLDLIQEVALQVPYKLICKIMGLPDDDWEKLYRMSRPVVAILDYPHGDMDSAKKAAVEMNMYYSKIVENIDTYNKESLIYKVWMGAKDKLAVSEILSTILLMQIAGTETSIAGLSNVLYTITKRNDFEFLKNNPDLIKKYIREVLRIEPPLHTVVRFAGVDTVLNKHEIKKWTPIMISLAAANRDKNIFVNPDCFDLANSKKSSISFGIGRHGCPGFELAEREFELVILTILKSGLTFRFNSLSEVTPTGHVFRKPEKLSVEAMMN